MGIILKTVEFWQCKNPDCGWEWPKTTDRPPRQCVRCNCKWWYHGIPWETRKQELDFNREMRKPRDLADVIALR